MHTRLNEFIPEPLRSELESIIRSCVHCGFCNATCPTYQLLGDELDGPRGRIYLIKQALEGKPATRLTQQHLDRCLTCRACETTCPSGVQYGRLLDAGRVIVERLTGRSLSGRLKRLLILSVFPYRRRFNLLLSMARGLKPILPMRIRNKIPMAISVPPLSLPHHARKMLILPGCVQPALAPDIDRAVAKILDKLNISALQIDEASCCGALPFHLSDHRKARMLARHTIDLCEPYLDQGCEAIVSTASGCGLMAKEYGHLLKNDPAYAEKAARFSAAVKDFAEILSNADLSGFKSDGRKVAFQSPCTLQHGQKLTGVVESILQKVGYALAPSPDQHMCCGSAGVYSLLQPELSESLRTAKLQRLQSSEPDIIATANVGCLAHLQAVSSIKVVHWVELLH